MPVGRHSWVSFRHALTRHVLAVAGLPDGLFGGPFLTFLTPASGLVASAQLGVGFGDRQRSFN